MVCRNRAAMEVLESIETMEVSESLETMVVFLYWFFKEKMIA